MVEIKQGLSDGMNMYFEDDLVVVFMDEPDGRMLTGRIANIGTETFRIDVSTQYEANVIELPVKMIDLIARKEN